MNPDEFRDGPGDIEYHDGIPCYTPAALPPDIELSEELLRANSDAMYALGQLSSLHRDMDNPAVILSPFIHQEAAMSSQIEGTRVTLSDIYEHEAGATPERSAAEHAEITEAYNYVQAIREGINRLNEDTEMGVELICELHEMLLGGVRGEEKRPGELRTQAVLIGAHSVTPDDARFVPARPEIVNLLLQQMFVYIQQVPRYTRLVDIGLFHYQFETIHPFLDGNGRLGRLLMILLLYEWELLPGPYLYLSAFFNANREKYLDHLLAVSRDGAWEEWVVFVLEALETQAWNAYESSEALLSLRNKYRDEYHDAGPVVRELVEFLFERPYITASAAIDGLNRSQPAVNRALNQLENDGIVEEQTGHQRHQVWTAQDILKIVEPRR